jgi:hypothetical protein
LHLKCDLVTISFFLDGVNFCTAYAAETMTVLLYGAPDPTGRVPFDPTLPVVPTRIAMVRNGFGEDPSAASESAYWRVEIPNIGAQVGLALGFIFRLLG